MVIQSYEELFFLINRFLPKFLFPPKAGKQTGLNMHLLFFLFFGTCYYVNPVTNGELCLLDWQNKCDLTPIYFYYYLFWLLQSQVSLGRGVSSYPQLSKSLCISGLLRHLIFTDVCFKNCLFFFLCLKCSFFFFLVRQYKYS